MIQKGLAFRWQQSGSVARLDEAAWPCGWILPCRLHCQCGASVVTAAIAAAKVVAKLLTEGLVEEVRARGSLPVWRRDDDVPRALRITEKGLQAIRVEHEPTDAAAREPTA